MRAKVRLEIQCSDPDGLQRNEPSSKAAAYAVIYLIPFTICLFFWPANAVVSNLAQERAATQANGGGGGGLVI